jgi:hypothetical protein
MGRACSSTIPMPPGPAVAERALRYREIAHFERESARIEVSCRAIVLYNSGN